MAFYNDYDVYSVYNVTEKKTVAVFENAQYAWEFHDWLRDSLRYIGITFQVRAHAIKPEEKAMLNNGFDFKIW